MVLCELTAHRLLFEKTLGYGLTPLLRRMICEVANGGFGESYGLIALVGGARDDTNRDVQQLLRDFRKPVHR